MTHKWINISRFKIGGRKIFFGSLSYDYMWYICIYFSGFFCMYLFLRNIYTELNCELLIFEFVLFWMLDPSAKKNNKDRAASQLLLDSTGPNQISDTNLTILLTIRALQVTGWSGYGPVNFDQYHVKNSVLYCLPRSSYPLYIVSYYKKWMTVSYYIK